MNPGYGNPQMNGIWILVTTDCGANSKQQPLPG
jgi:hypothetical protein